jgi:hypothetical protein
MAPTDTLLAVLELGEGIDRMTCARQGIVGLHASDPRRSDP